MDLSVDIGMASMSGRRGAIDCKSTLIATLEAVDELLRANFSPLRTAILSFGFDEEISGNQGARTHS